MTAVCRRGDIDVPGSKGFTLGGRGARRKLFVGRDGEILLLDEA